jgi:diacylglycerol kinase (ATP)
MLYLLFGTQQVMERGCRNLEQRLELYMDGALVELPEIESIVILNIPSWGAGCRLWDMLNPGLDLYICVLVIATKLLGLYFFSL